MKIMPRTHSFSKRIDRRRFDLTDADDNTIFLYERDDGVTVKCIRPDGVFNQFTPEPGDGFDANGSYTDYVIYVNDEPVTAESGYDKAQDTVIDICVSIDEHGVEDTVVAIEPQETVKRTEINHSN